MSASVKELQPTASSYSLASSKCQHPAEQVEVGPPCCSFAQAMQNGYTCRGQWGVWCSGCNNRDMTDADAREILRRGESDGVY